MKTNPVRPQLLEALDNLEQCLEMPVVPGEMERWMTATQQALSEVEPLVAVMIEKEHPQKLDQIADEDPALTRRVTQMKEQDQESLQTLKHIRERLEKLATLAESLEPDEAKLEEHVSKFVDAGIAFIIHVRKQEAAVETWFMEALDRDRGVAD